MRDQRDRYSGSDRLPTGHRDRVIVEDLVGEVGARGDSGAHRQQSGMVVGTVAQVDEDMFGICEGSLTYP